MSVFINSDYTLERALSYLENKVKWVELCCDGNVNVMGREEITENFNLKYTLHCPIADFNLSSYREKIRKSSLEFIKDVLETATKVNSEALIIHPGFYIFKHDYDKCLKSLILSLKDLNKLQSEYGINIFIENMPYDMFMFKNPEKEIIENLGELEICFDIGHAFINNNIDKFLAYKDLIGHVHIHDNNGHADEHLPIGFGKIDFEKYKKDLKNINGIKIIELHYKNFENLENCLNKLKNYLK